MYNLEHLLYGSILSGLLYLWYLVYSTLVSF